MCTVRSPGLACPACFEGDTRVRYAKCSRRVFLAYRRSLPFSLEGAPKNGLLLEEVRDPCFPGDVQGERPLLFPDLLGARQK